MSSRPLKIAVILHLENDHGHGILRGIAQFAHEKPQLNVLKFTKTAPLTAKFLQDLDVGGVIAKISDPTEEPLLLRMRLPAVNISGEMATPGLATVNTDDRLVGALGARYFERRGYRHLAFCGNETHHASVLRRDGFTAEAKRLGLSVDFHAVPREKDMALNSGRTRRALSQWLRGLPRPVGLLTFSDLVAIEAAAVSGSMGLRVPEDVAILGIGNDLTRIGFSPVQLSSIELNPHLIGLRAAQILFDLVNGRTRSPREELIRPLKIVTRRSTDRFAVDDEIVNRALDHIQDHIANTLYVDEIARAAATSRRALELRFQRALGISVYKEVQRQRMERAQELLANPKLTLSEISYATGHENARHLNLAFKRHFGITPGHFRVQSQIGLP